VNNILFIDATEELRPMAAGLEDAGFEVAHAEMSRVLEDARSETPAVLLFNLLGRTDVPAVRNLLRSADMPHGVASLAVIRSDQLGTASPSVRQPSSTALAEEVAARVRRAIWLKSGVEGDNTLRAGDLHIDLSNYKAYVAGRPIDLTYKEFELLRFLATNRDKVFTREALLNRVWGYDFYGGARTVASVGGRSKIEDRPTFIETVRNVGYPSTWNRAPRPPAPKPAIVSR
jgi:DNA-binding response OmpR family regulator